VYSFCHPEQLVSQENRLPCLYFWPTLTHRQVARILAVLTNYGIDSFVVMLLLTTPLAFAGVMFGHHHCYY
jgi:hypothetical protein